MNAKRISTEFYPAFMRNKSAILTEGGDAKCRMSRFINKHLAANTMRTSKAMQNAIMETNLPMEISSGV